VSTRLVTVNAKPTSGCAMVPAASEWGGRTMHLQSLDRMPPGECRA